MSAYLIIQAKITDWPKFKAYTDVVPSLVSQFGGEYIVMDGKPITLEGHLSDTSLVVSKWPSHEAAQNFWNSKEYQQAKLLREGTGEFTVSLVNGL